MRPFLKATLIAGFIVCFLLEIVYAQSSNADKLKEQIARLKQQKNYLQDTAYFNTLNKLAFTYAISYPDSAIALLAGQVEQLKAISFREGEADTYKIFGNAYQTKGDFGKALTYFNQAYGLAEKINYRKALPAILNNIGLVYLNLGNYPMALDKFYTALKQAETMNNRFVAGGIISNIATIHFYQGKMQEAENDYQRMQNIAESMQDTVGIILAYNNIGEVNLAQDSLSKALYNLTIACNLARQINNPDRLATSTKNLGLVYAKFDSLPKAIAYFETALQLSRKGNSNNAICKVLIGLATVQNRPGTYPQALAHALEAVQLSEKMGQSQLIRDANEITSSIYEASGDGDNALKHYKVYKRYSDSINNLSGERAALTHKAEYELSKQELEFERKALQKNWMLFSALAALVSIGIIAWVINRNRSRLDNANKILQHKNELIETEKSKAEAALGKLKLTQSQLIQSEKMASLGELTAGIAHEIQNPLNFVNNFSEVSKELLSEMKTAMDEGNTGEADDIANDVIQNLEKINYHGKRADAIVKGMLQHSRSSTGQKESTDINALCDEYLRLSYQGLRAKDKSFNTSIKTSFDETIKNINIIQQDIGRVILNLLTNAFFAVNDRKLQNQENYEPIVIISTKKLPDEILISVKDNGTGIPQKILDKIFQPFFTTKPTGYGTGLGLSLSYDIVKAHGGELRVDTIENEGTTFTIILPH